MTFLRVVEVLPPLIRSSPKKRNQRLGTKVTSFLEDVSRIEDYSDLVLVARLKDVGLLTVSTTAAASLLLQRGVNAAPVIVVRESTKKEFASTVLGAFSVGLRTLMLAWGDRGERSVHDFSSLSQAIAEAREISSVSGVNSRLLAPVDLSRLSAREGVRLARSRLEAGAELLLAQPPTADPDEDLEKHLDVLDSAGLRDRVLLSVFPFKDEKDVLGAEERFGWRMPSSLVARATSKDYDSLEESRLIVRRLRREGLPGVYLSTRESPDLARRVLG